MLHAQCPCLNYTNSHSNKRMWNEYGLQACLHYAFKAKAC